MATRTIIGKEIKIAIVPTAKRIGNFAGQYTMFPEFYIHHTLLNRISINEKINTLTTYSNVLFLILFVHDATQSITGAK